MATETDIAPVPLRECPSWMPCRYGALFSPDEGAGSPVQVHVSDRVLIIEDDLLIATQIEGALTDAGFYIIGIATTREEAIEVARNESPDLVVADIKLAGDRDGIDTALELFRVHGIRCIFASAYSSDREARQRAAPAAPLGWLQKPYSMALLTEMVRTAAKELRGKDRR